MSFQSVLINGTTFLIPDPKQVNWGQNVTDALVALADPDNLLQPGSGTFTLTDTLDFGGAFGLKASTYSSRASLPATVGALRLSHSDSIAWRNNADSANLFFSVNASDQLLFNGVVVSNTFTINRAMVTDGSGNPSAATTTATEIGYVNGVTSAIQTQLDLKAPLASPTFSGTITTPLTASRAATIGASNELNVSAVTLTELGYVSGVTSAIQTQLNASVTTALDNLAAVAINESLISDTDNTDDLGSSSITWKNLYLKTALILQETGAGTDAVSIVAPAAVTTSYTIKLPMVGGAVGDILVLDDVSGAVNTFEWFPGTSDKSWAFGSAAASSGTVYAGGFYKFSGSANDFSGGPSFGTANAAYGAHFFVVVGAATVDELTLTVTGTSITDAGVRATSATENIVIPNSTVVDSYFETTKKWIGAVVITVASGTAKICDFGYTKYFDDHNRNFMVTGIEATWLAGANDATPNIILRHHVGTAGNTEWTYTGSGPTPPADLASLVSDYVTEIQLVNGENGAWRQNGLSHVILGGGSEGILIEIVTTANKGFETGTVIVEIVPSP